MHPLPQMMLVGDDQVMLSILVPVSLGQVGEYNHSQAQAELAFVARWM
jgi:hypothetical protein